MTDTAPLIREVISTIKRYVVLPGEDEAVLLALFVLHTYAFGAAQATPYIVVQSPEKQSGKTRLLETLELLVRDPLLATGATEAALYRAIEARKPTILMDEVDAIFGQQTERTEALRGILNSGNRAGKGFLTCDGNKHEPRLWDVFCPKVLAGIDEGRLPDTILDRAIEIRMKRKTTDEPVERLRQRKAAAAVVPLRRQMSQWAKAWTERLEVMEPELPEELSDRAQDAWEPLIAVADLAGEEWPGRARAAALALSGEPQDDDEGSVGRRLLAAVRHVWTGEKMFTSSICMALNDLQDAPYKSWNNGDGIDGLALGRYLKPYAIKSKSVRIGEHTLKGFALDQFEEPWKRYLPVTLAEGVTDSRLYSDDVTGVTGVTGSSNGDLSMIDGGDEIAARWGMG